MVDPDTSGELWGRAGGRRIEYTVNAPENFTSLIWGALGTDAVTLAFDETVDAPGETLALGPLTTPGLAVWTGSAELELSTGGSLVLPTRLTLEVTDGVGDPVPLVAVLGGTRPGMDVLSINGAFVIHLLFEAQHDGSFGIPAGWTPVLDLFDDSRLPTLPGTPPGSGGPVLTGFDSGFFFEVLEGMSLEEHDSNMISQAEAIGNALEFLTLETIPRLQDLVEGHNSLGAQHLETIQRLQDLVEGHNALGAQNNETLDWITQNHQEVIAGLQDVLQALANIQFPPDLASSDDVRQSREELQQLLLILFGISPCPPDAPGCPAGEFIHLFASPESVAAVEAQVETLLSKVMDIQAAVEASASAPEIMVQVADVSHGASGKVRRWILTTTINGRLVDAELVTSSAVVATKAAPAVYADVTGYTVPIPLGTGVLDVSVALPPSLTGASVFQLDVVHDEGDVTAHGTALVRSVGMGGDK